MVSKQVILGGFGNLGRQLQRKLVEQGKSVIVLDRPNPNADRLLNKDGDVSFQPFRLGYDSVDDLQAILKHRNVETVYSLVTPDVQHGTAADFETTNVKGVEQLLNSCEAVGVPKLVFASSLAVTNHFTDSINEDESVPLPPIESYVTSYDRTKRQGEDLVRAASSENFVTVALRLGGILGSQTDYSLRQLFTDGPAKGTVYTVPCKPLDFIAGANVASAMIRADEVLSSSSSSSNIAGQALFCTKALGEEEDVTTATEIAQYVGQNMGWEVQVIPSAIAAAIRRGAHIQHIATSPFRNKETEPGMPFYMYLDIANYQQTFSNAKLHQALHWKPTLTVWQVLDQVMEDYKHQQKQKQ